MRIPFNIPFISGNERTYLYDVIKQSDKEGHETFIDKCQSFLKNKLKCNEIYLTSSCTAALEVSALLLDIKQGDEIIIPSYTFPTTAIAFIRAGANIVFADSKYDYPGMDENIIESLITDRTKAIVPVHYAGIACNMDEICRIAQKHNLIIVEDGATAIDATYKNRQLGSIGNLGCLSFHQTKNIQCGEGGALLINDSNFSNRVRNILEKGTNRSEFVNEKVDRYEWVDIGFSAKMSDLHAAYLYAQLEKAELIKEKRLQLWDQYKKAFTILQEMGFLKIPFIPEFAGHNGNSFYLVFSTQGQMQKMRSYLKECNIQSAVHYSSLDLSIFWRKNNLTEMNNGNSINFSECLLRLPLYNSMTETEILYVIEMVLKFYNVSV